MPDGAMGQIFDGTGKERRVPFEVNDALAMLVVDGTGGGVLAWEAWRSSWWRI